MTPPDPSYKDIRLLELNWTRKKTFSQEKQRSGTQSKSLGPTLNLKDSVQVTKLEFTRPTLNLSYYTIQKHGPSQKP